MSPGLPGVMELPSTEMEETGGGRALGMCVCVCVCFGGLELIVYHMPSRPLDVEQAAKEAGAVKFAVIGV